MAIEKEDAEIKRERELLSWSEVSLVLDSYEEIFSDFDPRPFSNRALSVDFLDEAKRATREIRPGVFELRFLVPKAKRDSEKEKTIKHRLGEHFKKHYDLLSKDQWSIIKQGAFFVVFGIVFMFIAAYILFNYIHKASLLKEFLIVLLQPGGWFLFWEGLNLIIFEKNKLKPDLEFYKKMTKAEIVFSHYS